MQKTTLQRQKPSHRRLDKIWDPSHPRQMPGEGRQVSFPQLYHSNMLGGLDKWDGWMDRWKNGWIVQRRELLEREGDYGVQPVLRSFSGFSLPSPTSLSLSLNVISVALILLPYCTIHTVKDLCLDLNLYFYRDCASVYQPGQNSAVFSVGSDPSTHFSSGLFNLLTSRSERSLTGPTYRGAPVCSSLTLRNNPFITDTASR